MKKNVQIFAFLLLLIAGKAHAQKDATKEALADFMDARFGMFIHWGPVALKGTEIGWSRGKQVPVEEYDNLYKRFNPVKFDAEKWVAAAKNAGMKYLTITARHHDGFCLWPSKYTDYNISQTPFKKDVVGALNEACKKAGIKFCIYYTVLDWHHPDYPIHSPGSKTIDPKGNMPAYVQFMKNQLKELITRYDPNMLWFDGQWESPWTDEMGRDIYRYVKQLKPSIITNNRLGKEFAAMENKQIDPSKMIGDYDTPEQTVGKMNMSIPWESSFTIATQWAWKPNDPVKPLKECLGILSKTAGGNGNLLLNIGPKADGSIEPEQLARLAEIGAWMKRNGEAIYGTKGGPYLPDDQFASTRKGNKVFIHVLNDANGKIQLQKLPGRKVLNAYRLADKSKITFSQKQTEIELSLQGKTNAAPDQVVVLVLDGDAEKLALVK